MRAHEYQEQPRIFLSLLIRIPLVFVGFLYKMISPNSRR